MDTKPRRKYAKEKEIVIPLQRTPTPLNRVLKVGQAISYSERVFEKSATRQTRVTISGNIEFLCQYFAVVRDKKGILHTFTATDVFTNDVIIEGHKKGVSLLAEILGLKEDDKI